LQRQSRLAITKQVARLLILR